MAQFLNDAEQALDRATSATNLLNSMEWPLSVKPFEAHRVLDIIFIKDEKRLAGGLVKEFDKSKSNHGNERTNIASVSKIYSASTG